MVVPVDGYHRYTRSKIRRIDRPVMCNPTAISIPPRAHRQNSPRRCFIDLLLQKTIICIILPQAHINDTNPRNIHEPVVCVYNIAGARYIAVCGIISENVNWNDRRVVRCSGDSCIVICFCRDNARSMRPMSANITRERHIIIFVISVCKINIVH